MVSKSRGLMVLTVFLMTLALLVVPAYAQYCGDGTVQPGEHCEGNPPDHNWGSIQDCTSFGYDGGTLRCQNCKFDLSGCTLGDPVPYCGDSVVQPGEQCDGPGDIPFTCQVFGYDGGYLSCINCIISQDTCYDSPSGCGNGTIDTGEECDGNNWGNIVGCENFGLVGTLDCKADCKFDMTDCVPNPDFCGNALLDPAEECDGNPGDSSWAWGNKIGCEDFGYNYGTLSCSEDCKWDLSQCQAITCDDNRAVCGVDGNTYTNYCFAQVEGTTVSYLGECQNVEQCYMPQDFSCLDMDSCYDADTITVALYNDLGVNLYPASILMSTYEKAPLNCVLATSLPYPWVEGQTERFTFECNNFGEGYWLDSDITITYRKADESIWRTAKGHVRIKADEACGLTCAGIGQTCGGLDNIVCCDSELECITNEGTEGYCGLPDQRSCIDPDAGDSAHLTRTTVVATDVEGNPSAVTDECVDSTQLRESTCNDDFSIGEEFITCLNECEEGACVEPTCIDLAQSCDVTELPCCGDASCITPLGTTTGVCIIEEPATCDDTDGGMIFDIQGTASGFLPDGNEQSGTDTCTGDTLTEYYCDSANIVSDLELSCPLGCAAGACQIPTCAGEGDTCGGIAGILCCENMHCALEGDYPDASGTCIWEVPPPTCEDSDGGIAYYTAGVVIQESADSFQEEADRCVDGVELTEYYCSTEGLIQSVSFDCSYGCVDGACRASQVCYVTGESCSGVMGERCCDGFACVYPDDDPYAVGICQPVTNCDGCIAQDRCLPYGLRMQIDGAAQFCSPMGIWQPQVAVDEGCQNNYECSSNVCSSGSCLDLREEFEETRGLIQRILDWLASIFGIGE